MMFLDDLRILFFMVFFGNLGFWEKSRRWCNEILVWVCMVVRFVKFWSGFWRIFMVVIVESILFGVRGILRNVYVLKVVIVIIVGDV